MGAQASGKLVQTGFPVRLPTGEVLLEYRILLCLPSVVRCGADGRLPAYALCSGGAALHLADVSGL